MHQNVDVIPSINIDILEQMNYMSYMCNSLPLFPIEPSHLLHRLAERICDHRSGFDPFRELSPDAWRCIATVNQDQRCPVSPMPDSPSYGLAELRFSCSNKSDSPMLWFTAFMHMFSYSSVPASFAPGIFAPPAASRRCSSRLT